MKLIMETIKETISDTDIKAATTRRSENALDPPVPFLCVSDGQKPDISRPPIAFEGLSQDHIFRERAQIAISVWGQSASQDRGQSFILKAEQTLLANGVTQAELLVIGQEALSNGQSPRKQLQRSLGAELKRRDLKIQAMSPVVLIDEDLVAHQLELLGIHPIDQSATLTAVRNVQQIIAPRILDGDIDIANGNRLCQLTLELFALASRGEIVLPTGIEVEMLTVWLVQKIINQEPLVILSPVCPDYSFDWVENRPRFNGKTVGDQVGFIGQKLINSGPAVIDTFQRCLGLPTIWLVGTAGFEITEVAAQSMNMSPTEFRRKIESTTQAIAAALGFPVGILPDMVGFDNEMFFKLRQEFDESAFDLTTIEQKRQDMLQMGEAVNNWRSWPTVAFIAAMLDAVIVDPASETMGRKLYGDVPKLFIRSDYHGS